MESVPDFQLSKILWAAQAIILIPILHSVFNALYNVTFHPLRREKGPLFAAMTQLPLLYHKVKGDAPYWLQRLHRQYGSRVRVGPNEVSFTSVDAWKDIYGHKSEGKPSFAKYIPFYGPDRFAAPGETGGILRSDDASHSRQRRLCSAAFSDKGLTSQFGLMTQYVDFLIQKLRPLAESREPFDMVRWFNYITFDIMADLTYGEPLGLLKQSSYTSWVADVFATLKLIVYRQAAMSIPILRSILPKLIPKSVNQKALDHLQHSRDRVDRRLKMDTDRPDIWSHVLKHQNLPENKGKTLNIREMYSNSSTFMLAGTETSATAMSGLTFLLLKNPEKMDKFVSEIRGAFESMQEVNMQRLAQLPYLNACIEEGLRLYPPVGAGIPRITPKGGAVVSGGYVPQGTLVYTAPYATYRSEDHFVRADEFCPERWLPDQEEFASDNKAAMQPFSVGPRNCLGKNLAYHEMRLILCHLYWHFDVSLETDDNWVDQKCFVVWEKRPLMISLSSAR